MSSHQRTAAKAAILRQQGALNPRPQDVTDLLFLEVDFFDPRDLVQVKYEMLRRVRLEGQSVSQSAAAFGFSRPTFYRVLAAFEQDGLVGLVAKKRGPRGAHKLTAEVVAFIVQAQADDPSLGPVALARRLENALELTVHPRSIPRALARQREKGR